MGDRQESLLDSLFGGNNNNNNNNNSNGQPQDRDTAVIGLFDVKPSLYETKLPKRPRRDAADTTVDTHGATATTSSIKRNGDSFHYYKTIEKGERTNRNNNRKDKTKKKKTNKNINMEDMNPTTAVCTTTDADNDDRIHCRIECSQHPEMKHLIVERHHHNNYMEPMEAFCEEVASTVRTYGVAIARNVVVVMKDRDENDDEIDEKTTVDDPHASGKTLLDKWADMGLQRHDKICQALSKRNLPWNTDYNNCNIVQFKEVAVRCKGRMDVLLLEDDKNRLGPKEQNEKPFWTSHGILNGIVEKLLYGGETDNVRPRLVYAGWIFSAAGSSDQPFHQDGTPLFPNGNEQLPPYALNVFIPLQDTTIELGPTEFLLHSHRMANPTAQPNDRDYVSSSSLVSPLPQRGDMLFYDYRVYHRGTANLTTDTMRSVLYLMYARPWFKEHVNFGTEQLLEQEEEE